MSTDDKDSTGWEQDGYDGPDDELTRGWRQQRQAGINAGRDSYPLPGEGWGDLDPLAPTQRRLDHELGRRMPSGQDPDEDALDGLEAHLKGTGGYSPDGSVWQKSKRGQEPTPSPVGHLRPPSYGGPRRARRRSWWRFW